jgi:hypothetical protein
MNDPRHRETSSAINAGSELADELAEALVAYELSPQDLILAWLGMFATLRLQCQRQFGQVIADQLFEHSDSMVRGPRVKLQH